MRRLVCRLRGHRWQTVLDQVGPRRYRTGVQCARCALRPGQLVPSPDWDLRAAGLLALAGAAGLAWAVWGQW